MFRVLGVVGVVEWNSRRWISEVRWEGWVVRGEGKVPDATEIAREGCKARPGPNEMPSCRACKAGEKA